MCVYSLDKCLFFEICFSCMFMLHIDIDIFFNCFCLRKSVDMDTSEYLDFRGEPLEENRLPTRLNVVNNLILLSETNNVSKLKCVDFVTKTIMSIWERTSIPILTKTTIKKRVQGVL